MRHDSQRQYIITVIRFTAEAHSTCPLVEHLPSLLQSIAHMAIQLSWTRAFEDRLKMYNCTLSRIKWNSAYIQQTRRTVQNRSKCPQNCNCSLLQALSVSEWYNSYNGPGCIKTILQTLGSSNLTIKCSSTRHKSFNSRHSETHYQSYIISFLPFSTYIPDYCLPSIFYIYSHAVYRQRRHSVTEWFVL